MTHVEHGELQAYLDGEVGGRASVIENHLRDCTQCASELAQLKHASTIFATALRGVDIAVPARPVIAMTAARKPAGLWSGNRAALARAAMFLLGAAALASAAIPGTVVHTWISEQIHKITATSTPTATVTAPAPAPRKDIPVLPAEAAAISIQPSEGHVMVVLTNVAKDANVRVRLVDATKAQVQATGPAAHARFRTGPGRIEVLNVKKGEVVVEIPRGVSARVVADGRVLFEN